MHFLIFKKGGSTIVAIWHVGIYWEFEVKNIVLVFIKFFEEFFSLAHQNILESFPLPSRNILLWFYMLIAIADIHISFLFSICFWTWYVIAILTSECFFYLDERNVHMLRKYILLTNASILIKSWPLKTKVPLRKKFWLLNTKRHQKCRRKIQPHPLHLHLLNLWKWKQHQYNHHPICW